MADSDKFVLNFTVSTKKAQIVEINGENLSPQLSFSDFYDEYLTKDKLEIDDSSYKKASIENFIFADLDFNVISFSCLDNDNKISFAVIGATSGVKNVIVYKEINSVKKDLNGNIDFLTQVNSRQQTYSLIEEELKKSIKNSYFIMVDFDNFKNMNDSYGHLIGDACIKNIASILKDIAEPYIFGRFGGDEFMIYCSDITEEKLNELINSILSIKYSFNKTSKNTSFVTCSLGITKVTNQSRNIKDLIKNADNALYESKKQGKNSATFYHGKTIKGDLNKVSSRQKLNKNVKHSYFDEELRNRTRKTIYQLVLAGFIGFSTLIGFNFLYDYSVNRSVTEMAMTLSKDISNEVVFIVNNKIEQVYSNLQIGVQMMDNIEFTGDVNEYLDREIEAISHSGIAENPGILLNTGLAYFGNGTFINIAPTVSAKTLIVDKQPSLANINLGEKGDSILFGYPVEKTLTGNNGEKYVISGLLSHNNKDSFTDSIIGFLSESTNRYIAIIDNRGSKICESSPKTTDFDFLINKNNLFNAFEYDEFSIEFEKAIENKTSNILFYNKNNNQIYFYTDTIEINDWKILVCTQKSSVTIYFEDNVLLNRIVVITFIVLIFLALVIFSIYSIKLQKESFSSKYLDPLTKTINSNRLLIDAKTAIKNVYDNKYVVYLSLSNIQILNEIKGIEKANQIFAEIARILSSEIFGKEIISRFFSDCFVLVVTAHNIESLIIRIREICDKCQRKIDTSEKFLIKFKAGIYNFTSSEEPIWLAIDRAKSVTNKDTYLYNSASISVFNKKELEEEELRAYIEHSQRSAFENNEFSVYYQGVYNLETKQFIGAEALCRWKSGDKSFIRPDIFIPLFEKNGFIIDLDLFVFETVCRDIRQSLDKNVPINYVSINVSRVHFSNPSFFNQYISIMKKYDINGKFFVFEITESLAFDKSNKINSIIEQIHSIGSRIAIDDFGTGYSNLNLLTNLNFDIIKIDKSILGKSRVLSEDSKHFIKSIVDLCKTLNKTIIFEGVESVEQSEFLESIGVFYIQGYYYSRPTSKEEYYRRYVIKKGN